MLLIPLFKNLCIERLSIKTLHTATFALHDKPTRAILFRGHFCYGIHPNLTWKEWESLHLIFHLYQKSTFFKLFCLESRPSNASVEEKKKRCFTQCDLLFVINTAFNRHFPSSQRLGDLFFNLFNGFICHFTWLWEKWSCLWICLKMLLLFSTAGWLQISI